MLSGSRTTMRDNTLLSLIYLEMAKTKVQDILLSTFDNNGNVKGSSRNQPEMPFFKYAWLCGDDVDLLSTNTALNTTLLAFMS